MIVMGMSLGISAQVSLSLQQKCVCISRNADSSIGQLKQKEGTRAHYYSGLTKIGRKCTRVCVCGLPHLHTDAGDRFLVGISCSEINALRDPLLRARDAFHKVKRDSRTHDNEIPRGICHLSSQEGDACIEKKLITLLMGGLA